MFTTWLFNALEATMPLRMDDEFITLITTATFKGKPIRVFHTTIEQGQFNLPVQEQVEFEDQLIEISSDGHAEVIQHFKTTPVPPNSLINKTLLFPLTVFSLADRFDTSGF